MRLRQTTRVKTTDMATTMTTIMVKFRVLDSMITNTNRLITDQVTHIRDRRITQTEPSDIILIGPYLSEASRIYIFQPSEIRHSCQITARRPGNMIKIRNLLSVRVVTVGVARGTSSAACTLPRPCDERAGTQSVLDSGSFSVYLAEGSWQQQWLRWSNLCCNMIWSKSMNYFSLSTAAFHPYST
jgi:hypothetical protein